MTTAEQIMTVLAQWAPLVASIGGIIVAGIKMVGSVRTAANEAKSNGDLSIVKAQLETLTTQNQELRKELKKCTIALNKVKGGEYDEINSYEKV